MFNPFSGWAENKKSTATALLPSIFGALPYPSAPSSSLKLMFTSFNPSILNCGVVSGEGQVLYQVVTDPHNPGYTVLKNASGKNVALVEWQSRPLVEIRGILSKQHIGDWMRLSRDRTTRIMDVRGIHYIWAPRDKDIELIAKGPSNTMLLARIIRGTGVITLEVSPDAIQLGILDSVVTATFLLQSGRNVD